MSVDTKALHKAMRQGLQASGDLVRIVLEGSPPEHKLFLTREVALGASLRVVYVVFPEPSLVVEMTTSDGVVRELTRKALA